MSDDPLLTGIETDALLRMRAGAPSPGDAPSEADVERMRALIDNVSTVAMSINILGATELGDAEEAALDHYRALRSRVEAAERRAESAEAVVVKQNNEMDALDRRVAALSEEYAKLREALRWVTNIGHGVGKAGGEPESGEFEDAMASARAAMTAAAPSPEPNKEDAT